jgi:transcriptional antiterminator RfaH
MKLSPFEACGLESAPSLDSDSSPHEGDSETQPRWYLVQCRARQDERALEHLRRQGFECYRPLYETERVRRGHKRIELAGLFPGYLFIRLDRTYDNWAPIRSTRGVIQIVRFNEFPIAVADGIVDQIRGRTGGQPMGNPCLNSGDPVIITEGAFSGIEAIFVASAGDARVMLLLNILHSQQTLSFPIKSVCKRDGGLLPIISTYKA